MCPIKGCKDKSGMCVHEKMMIGLVVIIILLVIAKAVGWF
jgi:hypothetical protein